MQELIAVAAIAMTVVLVASVKHRSDQSLLLASACFAVSFTTNLPAIFRPLDGWFTQLTGKPNLLGLLGTCAMVIAVYFISRAVLRASWVRPKPVFARVTQISLFIVLLGMILSFWQVRTDGSSEAFMLEYGDQPAAAIYSMLQFGYIGAVLSVLAAFTYVAAKKQTQTSIRTATLFITAACGTATIMVVSVFGMDIANLLGDDSALGFFASAYSPTTTLTMLLLCIGFSIFPMARASARRAEHRRRVALAEQLHRIKRDLTGVLPASSLRSDDDSLHRLLVEIQDVFTKQPEAELTLANDDILTLARVDQMLQS